MSNRYWQALIIYTSNGETTIKYMLEQGKLYGLTYNTHTQINVSIETALAYIKLGDEDEGHRIYAEYTDTTFTLRFSFDSENSSLYVSLSPPNSTWTLASLDYFIDNARYVKLLLYLSKNLPIYDLNNKIDPITFTIQAYSYSIRICITQDIFYLTVLEPYAIKVIDGQIYIDAALYVKIALAIYDTLPIIAMNTSFDLTKTKDYISLTSH